MKLNFEALDILKSNMPMDRAQRVDKNRDICLVFMFTPRVTVIKNVTDGWFFVFSVDESKKISHRLGEILKCSIKSSLSSFKI